MKNQLRNLLIILSCVTLVSCASTKKENNKNNIRFNIVYFPFSNGIILRKSIKKDITKIINKIKKLFKK